MLDLILFAAAYVAVGLLLSGAARLKGSEILIAVIGWPVFLILAIGDFVGEKLGVPK